MPHLCTTCSRTFADGSKEMLSGCPDCGGNKFQYLPSDGNNPPKSEPPERAEPSAVTKTAAKATTTVRDLFAGTGGESNPASSPASSSDIDETAESIIDGERDPTPPQSAPSIAEDRAQAAARSGTVPKHQLPDHPAPPKTVEAASETQLESESEPESDERMDLSDLREELNDQFESIKIVDRGQYELNLMELYEREEYIISLQENGRYAIEVPESVRTDLG